MKKHGNVRTYKLTGVLKSFFMWPVFIGVLLIIINISIFVVNSSAGAVLLAFTLAYIFAAALMFFYLRPRIMHEMIQFSSNYSQVQRQLLYELSVPYALLDTNGNVMWMNKSMLEKTDKRKDFKNNISTIFPEITSNIFPGGDEPKEVRISYGKRDYCVEMKRIMAEDLLCEVTIVEQDNADSFIAMYMFDETDINMYIQKIKDERFVVGLIYIDNYEEALESIDDVRRSLFIGLIDKRVNKYFAGGAAIVRKLEKDKYLVVFRHKYLEKLITDKFSLLEDIKSVKIGNEMTITLSMGIGTGGNDYAKNYDIAKASMDLALGRGGDQAVIKDGEKIHYYGGKSQQMEKDTRVKVRVKAHALRQILANTDNVLIMGHKLADIDSFGSAVGIYIIAKKLGKNAHIVIGDITSSVKPFLNRFIGTEEYPEDMFVNKNNASDYIAGAAAVIVVDVNRPQLTECPELLERCKTIVVFDHHRRSNEPINGAVLSYVDPYASSASEMVAEMIQYVDDGIKLRAFEADALYAGINIDTDGFNSKSGPRTFEAAAFLRRHGADVTRVRKMLRNDMDQYKAIAEAVSKAEVYRNAYAITVFNGKGLESPTIGGAKAANQLLDISGIKASFVITDYNGKIYISARSIDEVNVQLVMEKLGGGGHMSIAGAQLGDCTSEQAVQTIKVTLDDMMKEGEI
ncbi:MAG: DHH family phosphoesterase [Eubacteriales bacterium]|nr:DHH family phosphoesterase [Eubacteriales bacterium]